MVKKKIQILTEYLESQPMDKKFSPKYLAEELGISQPHLVQTIKKLGRESCLLTEEERVKYFLDENPGTTYTVKELAEKTQNQDTKIKAFLVKNPEYIDQVKDKQIFFRLIELFKGNPKKKYTRSELSSIFNVPYSCISTPIRNNPDLKKNIIRVKQKNKDLIPINIKIKRLIKFLDKNEGKYTKKELGEYLGFTNSEMYLLIVSVNLPIKYKNRISTKRFSNNNIRSVDEAIRDGLSWRYIYWLQRKKEKNSGTIENHFEQFKSNGFNLDDKVDELLPIDSFGKPCSEEDRIEFCSPLIEKRFNELYTHEDRIKEFEDLQEIERLMECLTEREKEIIELYYFGKFTYEEIGKILGKGITRERVRQLLDRAIDKMKTRKDFIEKITTFNPPLRGEKSKDINFKSAKRKI